MCTVPRERGCDSMRSWVKNSVVGVVLDVG